MIGSVGILFGRGLRPLRVHAGLRQVDLAARAKVSRSFVAKLESGQIDDVAVGRPRAVAEALDARVDVRLRWRGEQLDRQRGSIDVFAFHPRTRAILVVEVKSVVPDSQAMLHALDRKARLAPQLAQARGWEARFVGRLLVVADSSTSQRRIGKLAATYEVALPFVARLCGGGSANRAAPSPGSCSCRMAPAVALSRVRWLASAFEGAIRAQMPSRRDFWRDRASIGLVTSRAVTFGEYSGV